MSNRDLIEQLRSSAEFTEHGQSHVLPYDLNAAADALEGMECENKILNEIISVIDERLCCDGQDCGCRGSTKAQQAERYIRKQRPTQGDE